MQVSTVLDSKVGVTCINIPRPASYSWRHGGCSLDAYTPRDCDGC